ncbi:hypothetical protein AGMMS50230_08880 [Spirochaetia bacterium]|nr:hypothetical protein AGMMS50230_08880 [Spirochaetia bacterium]
MDIERLIEIKEYFIAQGYKMKPSLPDIGHPYAQSSFDEGRCFSIDTFAEQFRFKWEKQGDVISLEQALPFIKNKYPDAQPDPAENNPNWYKIIIPVDQSDPVASCFEIFTNTKGIIGYDKKIKD